MHGRTAKFGSKTCKFLIEFASQDQSNHLGGVAALAEMGGPEVEPPDGASEASRVRARHSGASSGTASPDTSPAWPRRRATSAKKANASVMKKPSAPVEPNPNAKAKPAAKAPAMTAEEMAEIRSTLGQELRTAAAAGDVAAIRKKAKAAGVDLNDANYEGFTPLMKAAMHGKVGSINALLDCGANVNHGGGELGQRRTALILAAANGEVPSMRCLLEHGADLRPKTTVGWSALGYAAAAGHLEAIRELFDAMYRWLTQDKEVDGERQAELLAEIDAARLGAIGVALEHEQRAAVSLLESLAETAGTADAGGRRSSSSSQVPMGELSPRSWGREATANRRGSFISRIVNRRGSRDAGKQGALHAVATFARRMSRDIL